jgi:UDP-N-acetylglucosamine 4,6-dehydratase/5-epimerase
VFNDKSILITGGTGSFGRAFVRHVLTNFKPKRLIIYSRDELKQFEMQQEFISPAIRFFIGDVRDAERLDTAFHGVDIVVHAAAMKQILAAEYNPMECIKTNIMGAQNIIRMALENNVEKIIALSTDKAANPVNLYGATKLASDKLFIAANNISGARQTRFSVVRYGNVMGSRGSVIPFFKKLIQEESAELPVTDMRMTRFWITLQQGVDFVMQSFQRMQGGEIFIPKLPSARIVDIVKAMSPEAKIKIIGIRAGEKLHELMVTKDDARMTLEFSDHYVIKPGITCNFNADYEVNSLKERGHYVGENFEYSSETNPWFFTEDQIRELA